MRGAVRLLLASVLLVGGCVAPPRDESAYRGDARTSLESATSDTRTVALALHQWLSGDATRAYADVVVTESEKALGPVSEVFAGLDPPTAASDPLRTQVLDLLADAQQAVEHGRIALRRSDERGVRAAAQEVAEVADRLEHEAEGLR